MPEALPVDEGDRDDERVAVNEAVRDTPPLGDAPPEAHVETVLVAEGRCDAVPLTVAQVVSEGETVKELQVDEDGDGDETSVEVGETELLTDELLNALPERLAVVHADVVSDCVAHALEVAVGSFEVDEHMDPLEVLEMDTQADVDALRVVV